MKIGNLDITLKLGSADVSAAYLGSTLVYSGDTPTPTKFYATYSDSTTYSAECDSSSALTTTTTRAHTTPYTAMTSAVIGDCITSIDSNAFRYCSSLTSITIPNSVTSIDVGAFHNCTSLSSIDIPSSVTSIGDDVFHNCTSLTSITIPSSVTSIGDNAFDSCSSLTSITIPNSVTSIGYGAFASCSSLASITIPNSVTSIGEYAFDSCTSLTSITCFAPTPPTLGSGAFNDTNNCAIYVPSGSVNAYKTAWSDYASRIQAIADD